jgi:hypothetical protein
MILKGTGTRGAMVVYTSILILARHLTHPSMITLAFCVDHASPNKIYKQQCIEICDIFLALISGQ